MFGESVQFQFEKSRSSLLSEELKHLMINEDKRQSIISLDCMDYLYQHKCL